MNEVINAILTRRSIRSYESKQIPEDALDAILQAAVYAPSGGNSQSWLFTVVQGTDILQTLNQAVREAFAATEVGETTYRSIVGGKKASLNPNYSFYYNAPTLIVVSNDAGYPNAMADCSVAIENMMLAAHSLGIGSCWINQLRWFGDRPGVRSILSSSLAIPGDYIVCGAVAFGFNAGSRPKAAPRREGTVHYAR